MITSLDLTAVPANATGVGRYVLGLSEALAQDAASVFDHDRHVTGIVRDDDTTRWLLPIHPVRVPASRAKRLVWEQTHLPNVLRRLEVDVHHAPHYTLPRFMTSRSQLSKLTRGTTSTKRVARVTTIHDLTFFDHPEWHQRSKVVFFRDAIRYAARNADALICVSEFTADRLRVHTNTRKPIFVIPHGVDQRRFRAVEALSDGERKVDDNARRLLGVGPQYVLFLGTLEPRKNLVSLVHAWDNLADDFGESQLVLAGGRGWGLGPLEDAIRRSQHGNRIRVLGFVPDDIVAALLRGASAVVYPSFEEGFGLPALEALACGAPVVTSSGSALEEVVGDAAVIVPPSNEPLLVDALRGVLEEGVDSDRRLRGLLRAQAATWERSAELHLGAYRCAFASN